MKAEDIAQQLRRATSTMEVDGPTRECIKSLIATLAEREASLLARIEALEGALVDMADALHCRIYMLGE